MRILFSQITNLFMSVTLKQIHTFTVGSFSVEAHVEACDSSPFNLSSLARIYKSFQSLQNHEST